MFNYVEKINVFRKFLLSYILILVIPLLSNYIVYQVSINKLMNQATESSKKVLNETRSIIDRKNEEIESFIYQMAKNPDVNQLMLRELADSNITYETYKVLNSIRPYWYTNTLFKNFYIYYHNIDLIVSPESSYVRPDDYYKLKAIQGIDLKEWNEHWNQSYHSGFHFPSDPVTLGDENANFIPYVHSLPFNSKHSPKANVVILIDENEITSLLQQVSNQYDGSTFIYDHQGNIIFNDNLDTEMFVYNKSLNKYQFSNDNKKFVTIETSSAKNNWTYVAVISKAKLSKDVRYIRNINFIIALATLIIGMFFSLLFSYKNSIPLNRLIGVLPLADLRSIKNPYDFLHSNIKDIISNNVHLKKQIQDQLPIFQDTVIRKLVTGEISSSKEAVTLIEQSNLPIKGSFGFIGIIQIIHLLNEIDKEMLDEMNVAQLFIQKELTDLFHNEIICSNVGADQVLFLLTYTNNPRNNEERKLDRALLSFISRLEEKFSLKVNIGIGRKFERLIDIQQSYEEARLSLPPIYSHEQKSTVNKYLDQVKEERVEFYFPIEMELRLLNAILSGEKTEVKQIINKIYVENIENKKLTEQIGNQILSSLSGTILRVLSKNPQLNQVIIDDVFNHLELMWIKKNDFYHNFNLLKQFFLEITQNINERKIASGQLMIAKIKDCIKMNFSDPNLTLYKISEMVSLPEKMVPTVFKEHTGINISEYIEDVRMNFAKNQLSKTVDTIENIAIDSGYNSSHSFRRAFKRYTGISPSDYRQMIKKSI